MTDILFVNDSLNNFSGWLLNILINIILEISPDFYIDICFTNIFNNILYNIAWIPILFSMIFTVEGI